MAVGDITTCHNADTCQTSYVRRISPRGDRMATETYPVDTSDVEEQHARMRRLWYAFGYGLPIVVLVLFWLHDRLPWRGASVAIITCLIAFELITFITPKCTCKRCQKQFDATDPWRCPYCNAENNRKRFRDMFTAQLATVTGPCSSPDCRKIATACYCPHCLQAVMFNPRERARLQKQGTTSTAKFLTIENRVPKSDAGPTIDELREREELRRKQAKEAAELEWVKRQLESCPSGT